MARPPAASVALIGVAGAGKSTLFSILSGIDYVRASRESAGKAHAAHVPIDDPRVTAIAEHERSAKIVRPILELVDTPPLRLDGSDSALLGELRQVNAYAVLIPAFMDPAATDAPVRSALTLADIDVMERAIHRLEKFVKRPTSTPEDRAQLDTLRSLIEDTADGKLRDLTPEEEHKLKAFQFFSRKPIIPLRNVAEDALAPEAICLRLEQDLLALDGEERREFERMYGITEPAAPRVAHAVYRTLDLVTFYTGGPTEAAAWPLHRGATAVDAASSIHTDLGRTFICAEVTAFDDYLAGAKPRTEGRDYAVKDGDVILIKAGGERKR